VTADEVRAFAKSRLGSVKAPKQVEVWPDLPRYVPRRCGLRSQSYSLRTQPAKLIHPATRQA